MLRNRKLAEQYLVALHENILRTDIPVADPPRMCIRKKLARQPNHFRILSSKSRELGLEISASSRKSWRLPSAIGSITIPYCLLSVPSSSYVMKTEKICLWESFLGTSSALKLSLSVV